MRFGVGVRLQVKRRTECRSKLPGHVEVILGVAVILGLGLRSLGIGKGAALGNLGGGHTPVIFVQPHMVNKPDFTTG